MGALAKPQYERFAQERAAGIPRLKAYELAGYQPEPGNAKRLEHREDVRARIREITEIGAELAGVHRGRILAEQASIAFANLYDYLKKDADGKVVFENGLPLFDLTSLTREQWAAVTDIVGGRPVFHDKVGVLRDLLRAVGPATGDASDGEPISGNEELQAAMRAFDGMSEYEIARRIMFAFEIGARARASQPQSEIKTIDATAEPAAPEATPA